MQRIDSGKDQIVDHISHVAERIRLSVDENDWFFPKIHPCLSINSIFLSYDISLSIRLVDIIHRV